MKKFTFFFAGLALALSLKAQLTITQSDMPQAGDTIRLSTTIDLGLIDYETTGEGITWDFSSLMPLAQRVDSFVSVQQTPWVYQLVFFGAANLAQPLQEFDQFPGFQVTDVYNFYKNSASDYRLSGYGVTLNSIPVPTKFGTADIIYHFPVNYDNLDSSQSSYQFAIPGLGYSGGWKKRINHADGWGTLITPFGSFETIRIKTEVTQYDSLHIDSLGIGFPVYRQFTEYKWLGNDFGLPLCEITKEGLLTTVNYIDSARVLFTNTETAIEPGQTISVYPNPVSEHIYIAFGGRLTSDAQVTIFNSTGKMVYSQAIPAYSLNQGAFTIKIDEAGMKPGIYVALIKTKNEEVVKKLLVR
ncbi:MAG: T9SS type A sorting domain-containing protein [Bacteroidales bacterium]|nr:T9SS type A sorting domain-containing protein [Bacteroidales bacterium]